MMSATLLLKTGFRPRAFFSAVLIVAVATTARAGPVGFTVGGTTYSVASFDESPGNVLSLNAVTLLNTTPLGSPTAPITSYYQASVILKDGNGNPFPVPGQVTVLARFNKFAVTSLVNGLPQSSFTLAADQTGSYFNFYYNPSVVASDLTGKGFGPDAAGAILIYSAAVGSNITIGQFQVTAPFPTNFDQSPDAPTNGYGAEQTLIGSGGTALSLGTTFLNSSYLTGGVNLGSALNFSSMDQTPLIASPSRSFYDVTTGSYITPSLSPVNGLLLPGGPDRQDFQFTADGISSFSAPEPASVTMTLMGLVGTVVLALRRRKFAAS
jgi:hypothetical protein